jgi:hypothetical protein
MHGETVKITSLVDSSHSVYLLVSTQQKHFPLHSVIFHCTPTELHSYIFMLFIFIIYFQLHIVHFNDKKINLSLRVWRSHSNMKGTCICQSNYLESKIKVLNEW